MDPVFWPGQTHKQGGFRVVHLHVAPHCPGIGICIAVAAEVSAGIVLTDVIGDIAGTFLSVVGIGREIYILADRLFEGLLRHTAGAVRAGNGKPPVFPAWFYDHAMAGGNFHQ